MCLDWLSTNWAMGTCLLAESVLRFVRFALYFNFRLESKQKEKQSNNKFACEQCTSVSVASSFVAARRGKNKTETHRKRLNEKWTNTLYFFLDNYTCLGDRVCIYQDLLITNEVVSSAVLGLIFCSFIILFLLLLNDASNNVITVLAIAFSNLYWLWHATEFEVATDFWHRFNVDVKLRKLLTSRWQSHTKHSTSNT